MKRPALTFAVLTWRSGYVLKMLLPPTARRTPLDSSYERSRSASVLARSEEHTSELQSWLHLVCRLLLEKKNRLDLMGRKVTDVLAKMEVGERDEAQLVQDVEPKEQLVFTGPADWSPDQAEQYIDWRIHQVDQNVAKLRQQLDDQIAMRRRWLAVTGGRAP